MRVRHQNTRRGWGVEGKTAICGVTKLERGRVRSRQSTGTKPPRMQLQKGETTFTQGGELEACLSRNKEKGVARVGGIRTG